VECSRRSRASATRRQSPAMYGGETPDNDVVDERGHLEVDALAHW